jgi:hypothetical protein
MARWHSCNILQSAKDIRHLWQFSAGGKIALQREVASLPTERLPAKMIGKDWHTLFQPKLNVAWLPADQVFLRVVQVPKSDPAETLSMLELQLEKLSPLPITQIVWGYELLKSTAIPDAMTTLEGEMQTVIVIIVERTYVDEFLGQLETQEYLADRLELPLLDQLRANPAKEDGAWIYPGVGGDEYSCLVAWWYGGTLRNLSLVHLPGSEKRGALLQEQLRQMTWAGELEGWMTFLPKFHLVADEPAASSWVALFTQEQIVEVVKPVPAPELAALTCKRATNGEVRTNLLPPEYTSRYKQRFNERLIVGALGTIFVLYVLIVAAYVGWVQVEQFRFDKKAEMTAKLGSSYTNTLQIKENVRVLQDQVDLQYAALNCYKAVSDFLPPELTLEAVNFDQGRKLTLSGTAGNGDRSKVADFMDALSKVEVESKQSKQTQLLFKSQEGPRTTLNPANQQLTWAFSCDLKRADE